MVVCLTQLLISLIVLHLLSALFLLTMMVDSLPQTLVLLNSHHVLRLSLKVC